MNSVDKLFNKIENHIQLKLDGFDSLISEGKIYLNEKKFCENKKHLLEIIKDRNKWENRVNKFLQKNKFMSLTLSMAFCIFVLQTLNKR